MNTFSCFNSLQTGKAFRTEVLSPISDPIGTIVSIPFKRERLSELID